MKQTMISRKRPTRGTSLPLMPLKRVAYGHKKKDMFEVKILRLCHDGSSFPAEMAELSSVDGGARLRLNFHFTQPIEIPIENVLEVGELLLTPLGFSLIVPINGSKDLKEIEIATETKESLTDVREFINKVLSEYTESGKENGKDLAISEKSDVVEEAVVITEKPVPTRRSKRTIASFSVMVRLHPTSGSRMSPMLADLSVNDNRSVLSILLTTGKSIEFPIEIIENLAPVLKEDSSTNFQLDIKKLPSLDKVTITARNNEEMRKLHRFLAGILGVDRKKRRS